MHTEYFKGTKNNISVAGGFRTFRDGRKPPAKKTFLSVTFSHKQKSGIPFRPLGASSLNLGNIGREKWSSALMG
jgi:hypothetical protein